ncbi:DUF167 domain-containing protein [Halothiobacillus sp. DCM-1]|uniref:DUF167 domain-containing protein n=1 Tax=Halothiobacillus sp. DCM-1 TaxID=3112558 RepID=UPI00324A0DDE
MTHPASFYHEEADRLIVRVKVQPRASKNAWGEVLGDRIKLYLTSPPVEGQANRDAAVFIAETCGVAKSAVTLHRGEKSRDKEFIVLRPKTPECLTRRAAGAVPHLDELGKH